MSRLPDPQPHQTSTLPRNSAHESVATLEVAETLAARIANGVLVFGSPPPGGRDLDLLARPPERAIIAATLLEHGYRQRDTQWVCFRGCEATAVDLVPAERWQLPAPELAALFDEAEPLDGLPHLLTPASHHVLLIAARRQLRASGPLSDRLRQRLQQALARDPQAWAIARDRAPLWNAEAALSVLAGLYAGDDARLRRARARGWLELARATTHSPEAQARLSRHLRRRSSARVIVAFSGLDGAGKSTQAHHLQQTLGRIGVEGVAVWPPAQNVLFAMNPTLKRALRNVLERVGTPHAAASHERGEPDDSATGERATDPQLQDPPEFPPLPRQRAPLAHLLAGIVALSQVLALRRAMRGCPRSARVLIFDRYTLDAIVYVRHRWGDARPLRWQCMLIRLLSPRPAAAYLLEIDPDRALARKRDFPLQNLRERAALYRQHRDALGVRTLDATRPADALCEEIAQQVWQLLPA